MWVIQGDQVTLQEILSRELLKDVSLVAAAGKAYEEPRLTCWYGALPYTYACSSFTSNTEVWCSYSIPPQRKFIWKTFSVNVACLIIVCHSGIHFCWSSVRLWRDAAAVASTHCSVTYTEMAATASAGTAMTRPHLATSPPLLLWVWATPESSASARFLHRSDENKCYHMARHFLSVSVLLPVCDSGGWRWLHLCGSDPGSAKPRFTSADVRIHTGWLAGKIDQSNTESMRTDLLITEITLSTYGASRIFFYLLTSEEDGILNYWWRFCR